jgi:hypothetical protein
MNSEELDLRRTYSLVCLFSLGNGSGRLGRFHGGNGVRVVEPLCSWPRQFLVDDEHSSSMVSHAVRTDFLVRGMFVRQDGAVANKGGSDNW